ncbi:hypothetical protein ABMA59_36785 [Mesorhizobium sp. CN2-181]
MTPTEAVAKKFLTDSGHSAEFEPDGNVAPDFLVDGKIAVEVTALHIHRDAGGRREPLRTAQRSLYRAVVAELASFGPSTGEDYWVGYSFPRPLPDRRT